MAQGRYPQIDIMKGFAILGVLFTHAAMAPLPSKPLTDFYALQAVPVFIVLIGMNLAMSLQRQAEKHGPSHYLRRLKRLAVPFVELDELVERAGFESFPYVRKEIHVAVPSVEGAVFAA